MDPAVPVELPGGLWRDGARLTTARVRGLVGADEDALNDQAGVPAARRVSELLARCTTVEGTAPSSPGDVARELSVGDREALLWHLRRLAFGETVEAAVDCGRCGEVLDVAFRVADVLEPRYPGWAATYAETLAGRPVEVRVPTGADAEAVAGLARTDPQAAGRALVERCLLAVDGVRPPPPPDDELVDAVAARLAELDPQAETTLDVACPACGAGTAVTIDAAGHLLTEVAGRGLRLYEEVHALAWHYHWGEREILSLTPARRARYLALIDDALSVGGGR